MNTIVCKCPRCNSTGQSVAAMNYRETQVWDKSGRFSGSGVGITSGGLGVGFASGSYSEEGTMQSKRAKTFDEPSAVLKPVAGVLFVALFVAIIYNSAPDVIGTVIESSGNSYAHKSPATEAMTDGILTILKYAAPVAGLALLIGAFARAMRNNDENIKTLETTYPKQLARYNELQYCENCHSLFDSKNRSADANNIGFDQMMSMS